MTDPTPPSFAPFDSDAIQTLLAVLDHGSFSAAARALGKVPSAVSMQIAQLEAALNMPLFAREGREPKPLPAALALEPQARLLAAQLQQLNAHALALADDPALRDAMGRSGRALALRMFSPESAARDVVAALHPP